MNCTISLTRSTSARSSATECLTLDGRAMLSFAAGFAANKSPVGVRAEIDSGGGGLSGDCPNDPTDGVAYVPGTSDRRIPQCLQKFAWLRLIAEQRGHCMGNLTPQTSQKCAFSRLRWPQVDRRPSRTSLSSSGMTMLLS